MGRVIKSLKRRSWRKIITYFLVCCMFLNTSLPVALADEVPGMIEGEAVVQGTASFNTAGNTTTITTGGPSTIIEYSRFNIDALKTVNFAQPDAGSAVLNRVIEANQSLINGNLISNGRVFLVNPAGIMFGAGSTVDVTQLVASGLGMTNKVFNDYIDDPVINQMEFLDGDGEVINRAHIKADSVYLIGKKVYNVYVIQAPDGLVVMAAGDEVRLFEDGSNVSVVVNGLGNGFPDVRNSSNINVGSGKIVLAAGDTFSRAIINTALLTASGGTVTANAAIVENRGAISVSAFPGTDGNGGSISLTGTEQVIIGESHTGVTGRMFANAGDNGNGGDITIQTEGKLTIEENSLITANGGSGSGNGGSVTITCDNFEIAGDIDPSFGNKMSGGEISEPGKLEITSSSVIIADGANAGALNTIYEEDIEFLSQAGTSIIVNAEEGITVKDITDSIGSGEITGQFGSIELHATGVDSAVTFADDTDTIRTSLGNIIIEAGSNGIKVGNLITGKDMASEKPSVGQIMLTTHNGGDIETRNLLIENGWRHAEINVKASGNLTVNGNVKVGSESAILNVPTQASAEAMIYLSAGDDVTLNGEVYANAHGIEEAADTTKAYIEILAGENANINGDLFAEAKSSNNGTADAVIKVEAAGDIVFADGVDAQAIADQTEVKGTVSDEEPEDYDPDDGVDHAQIIINANTTPPPIANDNEKTISKNEVDFEIDVLFDDTQGGAPLVPQGGSVQPGTYTTPAGTLTKNVEEGKIVSFNYTPPTDVVFVDNGDTDEDGAYAVFIDTFEYYAQDATGDLISGDPATVTITVKNYIPVASVDSKSTIKDQPVNIDVIFNDTDLDDELLTPVFEGDFKTTHGTLVLNEDGTFTYTPDDGFVGTDSFKYSATDSFNTSSEVEVKITVNEEPSSTPALPYIPSAPLPEILEFDISGNPALSKWVALELGVDERMIDIWVVNTLASTKRIQPYDTYTSFKAAATILQDADGSHIAALAQVINEFASSDTPPTEEQMASIADAIARNTNDDSNYAVVGEYLDALATYIGILSDDMGFSTVESVQFVTDKYVGRLAQGDNVGVATFIAASLAALGG